MGRFWFGVAMFIVEGMFQGLSHFQTLAFLQNNAPTTYALISSTQFGLAWALVATFFLVTGCIGIWKLRKINKSEPSQTPIVQTTHGDNSPALTAGRDVNYHSITQQEREGPYVALVWIWQNQGMSNYYYKNLGDEEAYNCTLWLQLGDQTVRCLSPNGNLGTEHLWPVLIDIPGVQPSRPLVEYFASMATPSPGSGLQRWIDEGKHLLDVDAHITFQDKYGEPWRTEWNVKRDLLEPKRSPEITARGPKKRWAKP